MIELNKCHVCGNKGNDDEIMLDLAEILECSNKRLEQWQKNNPKIMLDDWFCLPCASKIGNEIESEADNDREEAEPDIDLSSMPSLAELTEAGAVAREEEE